MRVARSLCCGIRYGCGAPMARRGQRGYMPKRVFAARHVYRCAACTAECPVEFGPSQRPIRLRDNMPPGWTFLNVELLRETQHPVRFDFWLCASCSKTPQESRALAALRHPIRILA